MTPTFSIVHEEMTFRRLVDGYNLTNALYNYEIYRYGRTTSTWSSDRVMVSRDVSILDFPMKNTNDSKALFFSLDRPSSSLGDSHSRKLQAFEVSLDPGFSGVIGWIRRGRVPSTTTTTESRMLDTKMIAFDPEAKTLLYYGYPGGKFQHKLSRLPSMDRNCVVRCSKHVVTGDLEWSLDGVVIAATCFDYTFGSIMTQLNVETGTAMRFGWSVPDDCELIPYIAVRNGSSCQFSAIELETL
jgi:hypothetical protein